jgi:hypothetical protein
MSSNTPAGGTAKPRMSSHHGPLPTVTPTSPATDRHAQSRPAATPAFPTFTNPPTTTSEFPVHIPHGLRAHPRLAVPFVVAASLVLS